MRKGALLGIFWGFFAWIPYYTDHLSRLRGIIGFPAAVGLELELALGMGDAFVFSIVFSSFLCGLLGLLFSTLRNGVKIVGLVKRKTSKRGS